MCQMFTLVTGTVDPGEPWIDEDAYTPLFFDDTKSTRGQGKKRVPTHLYTVGGKKVWSVYPVYPANSFCAGDEVGSTADDVKFEVENPEDGGGEDGEQVLDVAPSDNELVSPAIELGIVKEASSFNKETLSSLDDSSASAGADGDCVGPTSAAEQYAIAAGVEEVFGLPRHRLLFSTVTMRTGQWVVGFHDFCAWARFQPTNGTARPMYVPPTTPHEHSLTYER